MLKEFNIIFLVLLLNSSLQSQNIDSLKNVLQTTKHDTLKVDIANRLAYSYLVQGDTTLIKYLEKADSLASKITYKKGLGDAHFVYGLYYYYYPTDYDKSLYHYEKSLQFRKEIKDADAQARCNVNMGNVYWRIEDFENALENYLDALEYYKNVKEEESIADAYNNIGLIYLEQRLLKKAKIHFLDAEEIYKKKEMYEHLGGVYANLGSIEQLDSNYTKAITYFTQSKDAYAVINNEKGKAISHLNLGDTYVLLKQFEKAIPFLEKGLKVSEKLSIDYLISNGEMGLSTAYIKTDRVNEAIPFLLKAEKRVIQTKTTKELNTIYDLLSEAHAELGDYKKAYHYHVKFSKLEKKLSQKSSADKLAEMEAKFENHEKEKQLLIQKNKLTKQEAQIKTGKLLRNLFITIGVALFVIIVVVYWNYSQKKKANVLLTKQKREIQVINEELNQTNEELEAQRDEIERQKEVVEEAHNEIQSSINYARRIQHAILPSMKAMGKSLKDGFVLYQAKDVVAGDFYWLENYYSKVYFAAADCTGHGVPGAMVSVVCSNVLSKVVLEEGIKDTNEILDRSRDLVIKNLAKSGEEVRDGMDISLACIDFNTLEMQWSGANNSLYLIRNGELLSWKGDREPIGYFENPSPFTSHNIQLEKGDQIYLFTDGYVDQFGGDKNRKLGYNKFRAKLNEISTLSMEEQKSALETFHKEWRGNEEQLDDICIIGVKV